MPEKRGRICKVLLCAFLASGVASCPFPAHGDEPTPEGPSERIVRALQVAMDAAADESSRIAAIRQLRRSKYAQASTTLLQLLSKQHTEAIRLEVILTLGKLAEPACVIPLLKQWEHFTPTLKQAALQALTTHPPLAGRFLQSLNDGLLPMTEVDTASRQRLIESPDEHIAAEARRVLARQPLLDARATLARFKPAVSLNGDARRGREVFRERACFTCHRVANEGVFVGAELFNIIQMPKEEVLLNIVAPNLFFMPNFQMFSAETGDGELHEGVMAGTTQTTVILRRATGLDTVLQKNDIQRLKGLNVSLMPEGLLEGLTHQQVADLLEFISKQE